jgi:cob(I)alamin adenosyltransferase
MTSIYTKKGDKGKSALFDGSISVKSSDIFNVLGTIDELCASLGFVKDKKIQKIQSDLFSIGALLANPNPSCPNCSEIEKRITEFEEDIDRMEKILPKIKNFLLPGGTQKSSHLHISRTICRRLERVLVAYFKKSKKSSKDKNYVIVKYFNRLSDLLFVMARYANFKSKVKDVIWMKSK